MSNISQCEALIGRVIWLQQQPLSNFLLPYTPPSANYLFSPLCEHKVLGIGELWGTGMRLYLARTGLRWPANWTAPRPTLMCGHGGTHTKTLLQQALSLAESVIHHSSPVFKKNPILSSSCQKVVANFFWKHTYLSFLSRHLTKIGRIPDFIKSSMGGFLSLDSSFLRGKKQILA